MKERAAERPMKHATTGYVCAEDYLSWNDYQLPRRYFNLDQCGLGMMWVVKPARRLPKMWLSNNQHKHFTSELKGFWPSQYDEYALGQLPISIDSIVLKSSLFFWSCQSDFMQVLEDFQTEDHMPYRLDKRKDYFPKPHLILIKNIACLMCLYGCNMHSMSLSVCVCNYKGATLDLTFLSKYVFFP